MILSPSMVRFVAFVCLASALVKCDVSRFMEKDFTAQQEEGQVQKLFIKLEQKPMAVIGQRFLSIGIDSKEVKWKFKGFDFRSKKLQNLASALQPCHLRLGGTDADFLVFDPQAKDSDIPYPTDEIWEERYTTNEFDTASSVPPKKNFIMTGSLWSGLTNFTQLVGWGVMFDFGLFRWRIGGAWDPQNALQLLKFSSIKKIPIPAFQLGNEPNSFNHNFNFSISAKELKQDFSILKSVIYEFPMYRDSHIVGPDVTSLGRHPSSRKYLTSFLCSGAFKYISTIGLHQYYLNGKTATAQDFLNSSVLDYMKRELSYGQSINQECPPLLDIMMTETSSCFGGGAPGLSDRYVAGFLWLDKLGVSAQFGVKAVFRQSFFGGAYSLLSDQMEPRPDFFLSVLFKRLVEGPVMNVSVVPSNPQLRLYANCARRDFYKFPPGAVALYFLNLSPSPVTLGNLGDTQLFLLTPGDGDGLVSQFVALNGQKLAMSGSDLPVLLPTAHKGDIKVAGQSFGFIVATGAGADLCMA